MCHCLPCQIFDIIQGCWTRQCLGKARERLVPSTWYFILLVLCERNETCRGEGGTAASPGPPPWFYRCVNPIRVAFTPVPGNLKGNTHHLFFLVPCASSPGSCWALPPGPKTGNRAGGSVPPGSWDGCGQVPGTCISPPAASWASSFLSCPPSEGSSILRLQRGAGGRDRPPGRPEALRVSGTPPHPARRGSGDRTAS